MSRFVLPSVKKRTLLFLATDVVAVVIAMLAAMLITFNFGMDASYSDAVLKAVLRYMPINLAVTVIMFAALKLYISVWSFASVTELSEISLTSQTL